ncbi:hypothetical protein ZHAS_00008267 [Anopheles sinensis]|uniref:Protein kinase domain-containing protein n=1 Tax=Anopheles sinensis TaxID=74873 RepID=A0A084VRQ8_ANOSI|nr:hypothetical protein ZHAS_00008267 [Anopheles sinensis]
MVLQVLYADEDKATVQCQVDLYNFTGDFIVQSNERSLPTVIYADKNTWIANLTIKTPCVEHITCHAKRNDGSFLKQSLDVTIEYVPVLNCTWENSSTTDMKWYRNEVPIAPVEANTVPIPEETEVIYKCVAVGKGEYISKSWKIPPTNQKYMYVEIILGTLVVLLIPLSVVAIKIMRRKQNVKEYNLEQLLNHIIPAEYEFARENLKLGRKLGEGEYGIVLQAQADNIMLDEPSTTVAVKKPKFSNNESSVRMLVSELKVMIEVGQHLNVVNLLGAVTPSSINREFEMLEMSCIFFFVTSNFVFCMLGHLMIIMEYCEYGNLLNFLRENRTAFVRSLEKANNSIGSSITTLETDLSKRSRNEDRAICFETMDLIWWAAQIANGMAYLASKNVLHGDLAARNVLLTDKNVAKICDFGLARTLAIAACYKKKGSGPLPIKWLALESLSDNLFSVKSDVWSYGIVLWEMFSLGSSPYPTIDVNQLYDLLFRGYRMDTPEFASEDVYEIMTKCWYSNRKLRPTFDELADTFNQMMSPQLQRQYTSIKRLQLVSNLADVEGLAMPGKLSALPKWKYYM